MENRKMRNFARVILLLAGIVWGLGFIGNKMVLDGGWSDTQLMFVRFLFASIIVFIVFFKSILKADKQLIKSGIIIGIFMYFAFYFQTLGLAYTTASNNALVTAAYIILVPVVAFIMERKKIDYMTVIAAVVTLFGISLISVDFSTLTIAIGDLLTFLGSLFFAIQIYLLGHATQKHNVYALTAFQIFTFTFFAFFVMMFTSGMPDFTMVGAYDISLVFLCFLLGLFGSVIGLLCQLIGQKYTSAAEAGILMSTESVFAPFFAIIILNEAFTKELLFGTIFVFIGIIISESKLNFIFKRK